MYYHLEVKNEANLEIIGAYLYYEDKKRNLRRVFRTFRLILKGFLNIPNISPKKRTLPRSIYKPFSFFDYLRAYRRKNHFLFCIQHLAKSRKKLT